MQSGNWPPPIGTFIEHMQSEVCIPAPFMEPLSARRLGPVYEVRTYRYRPGAMPTVLERWAKALPARTALSPLAACWYSDLGTLNTFVHIWPYASLDERTRIRTEAAALPSWPPGTRDLLVSQESKIVLPAAFSPMQ